jgi:hypothetical protein
MTAIDRLVNVSVNIASGDTDAKDGKRDCLPACYGGSRRLGWFLLQRSICVTALAQPTILRTKNKLLSRITQT